MGGQRDRRAISAQRKQTSSQLYGGTFTCFWIFGDKFGGCHGQIDAKNIGGGDVKKYLVDVYLPTIGRHYCVYFPAGKKVGEATQLIIQIVESLTHGAFKGTDQSLLFNASDGEPIKRNLTVYDAGIRNSSSLILI